MPSTPFLESSCRPLNQVRCRSSQPDQGEEAQCPRRDRIHHVRRGDEHPMAALSTGGRCLHRLWTTTADAMNTVPTAVQKLDTNGAAAPPQPTRLLAPLAFHARCADSFSQQALEGQEE